MTAELDRIADRLLVVRAQAGDPDAFGAIVARFGGRLRYYAATLVGRSDVEDLLQEVWAEAYRTLPGLREPAALAVWLYRIARGKAARRRPRRDVSLDAAAADPPAADSAEPEIGPEEAEAVHAALARLPPAQREALTLRFLEGMTYEQIAVVTRCPVGTVRSRLHLGKRALRAMLNETRRR